MHWGIYHNILKFFLGFALWFNWLFPGSLAFSGRKLWLNLCFTKHLSLKGNIPSQEAVRKSGSLLWCMYSTCGSAMCHVWGLVWGLVSVCLLLKMRGMLFKMLYEGTHTDHTPSPYRLHTVHCLLKLWTFSAIHISLMVSICIISKSEICFVIFLILKNHEVNYTVMIKLWQIKQISFHLFNMIFIFVLAAITKIHRMGGL